jgi:hypothetical protein
LNASMQLWFRAHPWKEVRIWLPFRRTSESFCSIELNTYTRHRLVEFVDLEAKLWRHSFVHSRMTDGADKERGLAKDPRRSWSSQGIGPENGSYDLTVLRQIEVLQ